jgi:hypothetical protein
MRFQSNYRDAWESREKVAHFDAVKEYEAANKRDPFANPPNVNSLYLTIFFSVK